ncbi:uncharacterized protein LOC134750338 [Cydia strobilella]|uniref:uncharacterized protein LOC134750338 n=1 Tax=Cydia strobilella TaxID=1100964 RepID=UPI00300779F7
MILTLLAIKTNIHCSSSFVIKQGNMRLLLLLHLTFIIEARPKKLRSQSRSHIKEFNVDTHPNIYDNSIPIDFLNMGVSGVYDPSLGQKQPFDGVALYLVHQRKSDEDLRALLQQAAAMREQHKTPAKAIQSKADTFDLPPLFDFETIHTLNLAKPQIYKDKLAKTELLFKKGRRNQNTTKPEDLKNLEEEVPLSMFDMKAGVNEDVIRWTSCDDFAKKARFHPRDVAGVDWVPFYLWSMQAYPIPEEFKFSYRRIVQEYKDLYESKLTKKIDWSAPMLLLRNWLEMLLVAGDKRGLFYGIPKSAIPDDIRNSTTWYPHATIRMKMVDQYLAMMFCEEHLAMMLAVVGEEPDPQESAAEAAKLGFHGIGSPVTKQGQVGSPKDDRFEDFDEKMNLDRHSAVVKSFYTP